MTLLSTEFDPRVKAKLPVSSVDRSFLMRHDDMKFTFIEATERYNTLPYASDARDCILTDLTEYLDKHCEELSEHELGLIYQVTTFLMDKVAR